LTEFAPKVRFASDSPLEEGGFEPSVPLGEKGRSEARRGGVAVSSRESALCVEGTAAAISEVRTLVPISVEISPIESLLAEKLWVAGFRCPRFEVLGGLVIILRETSDHAF
jgi:hypothetical protein